VPVALQQPQGREGGQLEGGGAAGNQGRAAGRGRSSWKGEGGLLLDWER